MKKIRLITEEGKKIEYEKITNIDRRSRVE